jgi:hypothetical protein
MSGHYTSLQVSEPREETEKRFGGRRRRWGRPSGAATAAVAKVTRLEEADEARGLIVRAGTPGVEGKTVELLAGHPRRRGSGTGASGGRTVALRRAVATMSVLPLIWSRKV